MLNGEILSKFNNENFQVNRNASRVINHVEFVSVFCSNSWQKLNSTLNMVFNSKAILCWFHFWISRISSGRISGTHKSYPTIWTIYSVSKTLIHHKQWVSKTLINQYVANSRFLFWKEKICSFIWFFQKCLVTDTWSWKWIWRNKVGCWKSLINGLTRFMYREIWRIYESQPNTIFEPCSWWRSAKLLNFIHTEIGDTKKWGEYLK